jgi:hypothetical protein
MRCTIVLALVPLLLAGCITPFTSRLDEANARAAAVNQQLIIATNKLDEATRILERSEAKLDQANKTFDRIDDKLGDMDKRFATIETGFRKLLGIKGPEEQE